MTSQKVLLRTATHTSPSYDITPGFKPFTIFKLARQHEFRSYSFGCGPTLSPGPSPRSKWRSEKLLAKAAEILHESEIIVI